MVNFDKTRNTFLLKYFGAVSNLGYNPTLKGYEAMHMIRKGQIEGVGKGDILNQVNFIEELFGIAA